MKRKLAFVLAVATLACSIVGCAGLTHCKECDDEIYKEGYCEYHYDLKNAKDKIDEIGKDLHGIFGGDE